MARSTTFSVPLWDITSRVTKELLCPTRHEQRITWVTSLPWQALMSSRTLAVLRLTCDACKPESRDSQVATAQPGPCRLPRKPLGGRAHRTVTSEAGTTAAAKQQSRPAAQEGTLL